MHAFVLKELRRHIVRSAILLSFGLLFELDQIYQFAGKAKVT